MRMLFPILLLATAATAQPATKAPVPGVPTNPDALKGVSGEKLPRFVSLRSGDANMRTGPGRDYPISWNFRRAGIPLEVLREWNVWRLVRDPDGATGWMDRAMLSGERTLMVTRSIRTLHAQPDVSSPAVWRAEPGVVGRVVMCANSWCRIEIEGKSGYILREHTTGSYPNEPIG
ncbi:SH3 domain-containing protein [Sandaracinobacteroides saxicola]|uniref:SH3-like domain-containing protein n=1 Tax=Sandaracinobacteroides saxicola TaxID=2759707 RepID=A0A7G5IIW2_9SPHN|nr:SH3 domain-containing protein [Sandaracinobacteroides saxicola]QMW23304.1 hypothetical protein H3309_02000 [Sandaracinobacteroides saxicola]